MALSSFHKHMIYREMNKRGAWKSSWVYILQGDWILFESIVEVITREVKWVSEL